MMRLFRKSNHSDFTKHDCRADLILENGIFLGNVSIDDRVFTEAAVTLLKDNTYRIAPLKVKEAQFVMNYFIQPIFDASKGKIAVVASGKSKNVVSAKIDGIQYEAAEMIINLDNNTLRLDDKIVMLSQTNSLSRATSAMVS